MSALRLIGLFALIPTAVLLTVSFFVLFTLRKVEKGGEALKSFGYIVAALLWLAALIVISAGVYTIATGRHPMKTMCGMMMKPGMQQMTGTHLPGIMRGQR